jgi:hypothetical protein
MRKNMNMEGGKRRKNMNGGQNNMRKNMNGGQNNMRKNMNMEGDKRRKSRKNMNMEGGKRRKSRKNMNMEGGKRRRNMNMDMNGGAVLTVGTKAQVYHGTAKHTSGGLKKHDLMKTKKGRIVSRKKHAAGKKALRRLVKAGYKAKKGTFKLFKK